MPAFAPVLSSEPLLEDALLLGEALDDDVGDAVGELAAEDVDEERTAARRLGMVISCVESFEEQQSVLLVPQHHFVALYVEPQGVRGAVPSSECCCQVLAQGA
jgi:hypothetical protein